MRTKNHMLFWLFVSLLLRVGYAQEEEIKDPFSNDGRAQLRVRAMKIRDEDKPTSDTVLPIADYFLKQFNKPRKADTDQGSKTFTLAGSDDKVYIFTEIATTMQDVASKNRNNPEKAIVEWGTRKKQTLDKLQKSVFGQQALQSYERQIWDEFLSQWEEDVKAKGNERFVDALEQGAYEIAKVGLDIQELQEIIARSAPTTPQGSRARVGSGGRISGVGSGYPFHERMMNHIYRKHQRRINRSARIRARGGR